MKANYIYCPQILRGKPDRYPNLTIKKIPKAVMARCEWGKDDYSLQVENLPQMPLPMGQQELKLGQESDRGGI